MYRTIPLPFIKDLSDLSISYFYLGKSIANVESKSQALKYFKRSLKLAKEIKYKAGIGGYSHNIAKIYMKKSIYI